MKSVVLLSLLLAVLGANAHRNLWTRLTKRMPSSLIKILLFVLPVTLWACNVKTSGAKHPADIAMLDSSTSGESYQVYYKRGKAGMLDQKGKVILQAQFDYIEENSYNHLVEVDSGGHKINDGDFVGYQFKKYGLVDTHGKIILRPQFDLLVLSDHTVMVKYNSLYGYTDDLGNWLIEPQYKDAKPFDRGAAIVKEGNKYAIINKKGQHLIKQTFDELLGFKNGVSMAQNDSSLGFVNYKGKIIVPISSNQGASEYNWNYGKLFRGNKIFLVDTLGRFPLKQGFDTVETYEGPNNTTIAKGKINGKHVEFRLP